MKVFWNFIKQHGIPIILLLFIFPLGVIYMWLWTPWRKAFKIILSALLIIFSKHMVVLYMIFYGYFLYPEASAVLSHYCFGDGSRLVVNSDYLKRSRVILYHLKKMKTGKKRRISMHQMDDLRLSYVLNPLHIEKLADKVVITQQIEFNDKSKTKFGPIELSDGITHVFDCTPFLFYAEFPLSEIDYKKEIKPNIFEAEFSKNHKSCDTCFRRNYIEVKIN
jgi:hypothetical protein